MRARIENELILVSDVTDAEFWKLYGAGFVFDCKHCCMSAPATLFSLTAAKSALGTVSPEIDSLIARMTNEREEHRAALVPPVKVKLFDHQLRGFHQALEHMLPDGGGYGLLFEVGCGKTITAIAIAGALAMQERVKRVLVVCPGSVGVSWQDDLMRLADYPVSCALLFGTKERRLAHLSDLKDQEGVQYAVINYESIWRDGIREALTDFKPDMIICDESQRIKTHNSACSKFIHILGSRAPFRLILSGTPITQNCLDIFSQWKFLDRSIFGGNFAKFKSRYVLLGGFQNRQVVGQINQEELKEKMHSAALRVTKADALDLPEQIFITRTVDFTPGERKAYEKLRKDSATEIEAETVTAETVLTRLMRLQQFAGGFCPSDDGAMIHTSTAKMDALEDIIEEVNGKIVIFATFTAELKAIRQMLDQNGIRYGFIDGSVKMEARPAIVTDFQQNPQTKVFLAQTASAGLGITLTAASTTVFYSRSWRLEERLQSIGRTHRVGQKEKCVYIDLVVRRTVDQKVLDALQKKSTSARDIVDDWRAFFA